MRAASEAALQRGGERLAGGYRAAREGALRLASVRAAYVLAPVVVLQLLAVLVFALRVPHNGWLYYNGGDATTYWLSEYAIGHGHLPSTWLGYVLPVAYGWVPLLGTTLLEGAAAIVLLQVLVLVPLATVLVYAVARRIAGPLFALFAAVAWVAAPFASLEMLRPDFRERFHETFLPQAFGLVNMGDFPSVVVLLAVALFVFRVLDEGRGEDALLAGLLLGLAVGIKPSNALMLPLPALVFALRRYPRSVLLYGVALVPALVTLAVWKQRGLGTLPLFAFPEAREALGASIPGVDRVNRYLHFDWSHFADNLQDVREYFWSRLLVELLPIAGAFAVMRKSVAKGLYLALWAVVFFVVKGAAPQANVTDASYFRLTMPGLPAYLLLAAAVALLVPRWGRRAQVLRPVETLPAPSLRLAVAIALLALAPFPVVALARPVPPETLAYQEASATGGPISAGLDVRPAPIAGGVRLTWQRPPTGSSDVFYVVYRGPATDGDGCLPPTAASLPQVCNFRMAPLARTGITRLDDTPRPGRYVYRVGVFASWSGRPDQGDLMLLSPPVAATVR
jgi:hypothetical protein